MIFRLEQTFVFFFIHKNNILDNIHTKIVNRILDKINFMILIVSFLYNFILFLSEIVPLIELLFFPDSTKKFFTYYLIKPNSSLGSVGLICALQDLINQVWVPTATWRGGLKGPRRSAAVCGWRPAAGVGGDPLYDAGQTVETGGPLRLQAACETESGGAITDRNRWVNC